MTTDVPAPIVPAAPVAPDADWLTIRDRITGALRELTQWTDHNAPDPGITLLEASAFAAADVHYRIDAAGFADWPLSWPGWLPTDERPWTPSLPDADDGSAADLADALAALLAVPSKDAEREVRAAPSRRDAEALLTVAPFASAVAAPLRPFAVTLLRAGLVRQVALEHADVIADAVAQADSQGGTPADRDERAAIEVEARTGLWKEECEAFVVRERRRLMREAARPFAQRIAETSATGLWELIADLKGEGLSQREAEVAAVLPRVPVGTSPEELEGTDGATEVWPPHPIQALTCEPVVAEDYARRARTHTAVKRAWCVSGRLKGIAWNGLPTRDITFVPTPGSPEALFGTTWRVDEHAKALTIVIEAPTLTATDHVSLRAILAHAVGTEVFTAAPTWRDSLDPLDPRRLISDEVGIALLSRIQVLVQATLIIPPTASATTVVAGAMAAVSEFFVTGRKETPLPGAEDPLTGPWEPAPQPPGGWVPGEPVRFSEVVEQLMGVPEVIAVTSMAMRTVEQGTWTLPASGFLALPAGTVPVLADPGCFTTAFNVAEAPTTGGCNA